MGILKRLSALVKSNADDLISRAEDPEKMLNQAIVEMGHQLQDAKKQVAEAIATEKRLRKQWELELQKAKGWKEKATMAVKAEDDDLAKQALSRKREHEDLAEEYQKQWESQKAAVEGLKTSLRTLNSKIEEARRKKKLLVAKKQRADAQIAMNEGIAKVDEESAFETFERMEKKIEQAEAEAEAAGELAEEKSGDELSAKFAQLEAADDEDMELLALKEELGLLEGKSDDEDEIAGQLGTGLGADLSEELEAEASAEQKKQKR